MKYVVEWKSLAWYYCSLAKMSTPMQRQNIFVNFVAYSNKIIKLQPTGANFSAILLECLSNNAFSKNH